MLFPFVSIRVKGKQQSTGDNNITQHSISIAAVLQMDAYDVCILVLLLLLLPYCEQNVLTNLTTTATTT
jgi:hypothetical protein